MPGAAQDGRAGQLVGAWLAHQPLLDRAEAERAAVVRTAVAHAPEPAGHTDDSDLTTLHAGDDSALALEVGDRSDVVPAHAAAWSPSRSP